MEMKYVKSQASCFKMDRFDTQNVNEVMKNVHFHSLLPV